MEKNKIKGMLGLAARAGKISFGTESCKSSVEKRKSKLVLIASDASDRTKTNFKNLCEKYNVKIMEVLSEEEINHAIGKKEKVVIGIEDINFSKEILKIINGGEIIG